MKIIRSTQNDQIKQIHKLKQTKYQKKFGAYLLEGPHEVQEAIQAHAPIKHLLITEGIQLSFATEATEIDMIQIEPSVSAYLSDTKATQGIFAVIKIAEQTLPTDLAGGWILLDALQDPGNLGTIIRTADALGLKGVILGEGTVSVYNPKVLRALQGSQFHLQIVTQSLLTVLTALKQQQIPVFGTALTPNAVGIGQIPATSNFAVVIGNEGNGVSDAILAQTTQNIVIPIRGKAESLNAAVAAAIIMYHFSQG
ncbi:TrmH family RNA methyltransferase [Agrilactobacillus fermenti]|uniref:TrmH family RNA methyltransferase n=1 Tax=Agrilactobacillus fermenti TaxID=2586909 RepID=UPI003A5C3579